MGRSVSYLPNAKAVVYFQFDEEEHVLFDYLIEDIQEHVTGLFPNMETCDEWVGEFGENDFVNEFGFKLTK